MSNDDTAAVGRCPDHGIVYGDDAIVDFPIAASCNVEGCGKDLENAGYADLEEVKAIA